MPEYKWRGINVYGRSCSGIARSQSVEDLQTMLFKKNIALLRWRDRSWTQMLHMWIGKRSQPKRDHVITFFHHFALLINSGITIEQALTLSRTYLSSAQLRDIINQLSRDVQSGNSLHGAMKKHPDVFSVLMVQLVAVGERSGSLGTILKQMTRYFERKQNMRNKLLHAALLPGITLAVAVIVTVGIFLFVVPQFEQLFMSMHQDLPASTRIILYLSTLANSPYFLVGICAVGIILFLLIHVLFRLEKVRSFSDKTILKVPVVGTMCALFEVSLFVQTLTVLLKSGIPLKQALDSAHWVISNTIIRKQAQLLCYHIEHGMSLENAFKNVSSEYFPPTLIASVAIGEQTGMLDVLLEKAQRVFEESLDSSIKTISNVFQPLLLIIVGLLIAGVMLAVYIPIFNLAGTGFS